MGGFRACVYGAGLHEPYGQFPGMVAANGLRSVRGLSTGQQKGAEAPFLLSVPAWSERVSNTDDKALTTAAELVVGAQSG